MPTSETEQRSTGFSVFKEIRRTVLFRHDILFAVITLSLIALFWRQLSYKFGCGDWSEAAFYAAIFDWSSVQSGFLFGAYAIIASGGKGLLVDAIQGTKTLDRVQKYVKKTMYLALLLVVISIPLLVASPELSVDEWRNLNFIVMAIYATFSAYMLGRFLRCIRQFIKLEKKKPT